MTSLLRPVPKLIWNASASVPIGLYAVKPNQCPSRRRPGRCQAAGSARGLPRHARLSGERRTAPEAYRRPSRSSCLPNRPHDHRQWGDDGPCARPRSSRTDLACLGGLPARRRSRGVPDELAVRELARRPLFRPAPSIHHRRPRQSALDGRRPLTCVSPSSTAPRLCTQRDPHSFSVPAMLLAAVCRWTSRLKAIWRPCLCSSAAVVLLCGASPAHAQPSNANGVTAAADRIRDFVNEASQRFAIPPSWIRAVMRVESLGDPLALSPKGAMGLMQIMPDTWSELRSRYGLGADPYDPHDNIVAGAAYLRELHDRYGERGFLAAYNAGPGRYEDHLATGRPLPSETLLYMAAVGSLIGARLDDGEGRRRGLGVLMDFRAAVCGTSGSWPLAISTGIQFADAKGSRWRTGAKPDSAGTALRWAVRQAIRTERQP